MWCLNMDFTASNDFGLPVPLVTSGSLCWLGTKARWCWLAFPAPQEFKELETRRMDFE